ARAEGGDLLSAPEHVGRALHDDERLPADVALGDELLALVDGELDRRPGDVPQLLVGAAGEQRDLGEVVEVLLACHERSLWRPGPRCCQFGRRARPAHPAWRATA